jgi:flagellar biosynthesis/type III secretory pathway protein FliH
VVTSEFVTLASWLRSDMAGTPGDSSHDVAGEPASIEPVPEPQSLDDVVEALREARRFRARLADAFEAAAQRLLRELAADVLARELRLEPCEIDAIVRRIAGTIPVVRVRVAPSDAARVVELPVVGDDSLAPGDAIVELEGGMLDARLGVRLSVVLEAIR